MGCVASILAIARYRTHSASNKIIETNAATSRWKSSWREVSDALEQLQMVNANWIKDEQINDKNLLVASFRSFSVLTTDIYIYSRPFLAALDMLSGFLEDALRNEREIYDAKANLLKTRKRLEILKMRYPKVVSPVQGLKDDPLAPLNPNGNKVFPSETKYNPKSIQEQGFFNENPKKDEMSVLLILEKRYQLIIIQGYEKMSIERQSGVILHISEIVNELLKKWELLSNLFISMQSITDNENFSSMVQELAEQQLSKSIKLHKLQFHDTQMESTNKLHRAAKRCLQSLETFQKSMVDNLWSLLEWLLISQVFENQVITNVDHEGLETKRTLTKWLSLIDPKFTVRFASVCATLRSTLRSNFKKELLPKGQANHKYPSQALETHFKEYINVLNSIKTREKELKNNNRELLVITRETGNKGPAFEQAQTKVFRNFEENRRFKIEQVSAFQQKCVQALVETGNDYLLVYRQISRELGDVLVKLGDSVAAGPALGTGFDDSSHGGSFAFDPFPGSTELPPLTKSDTIRKSLQKFHKSKTIHADNSPKISFIADEGSFTHSSFASDISIDVSIDRLSPLSIPNGPRHGSMQSQSITEPLLARHTTLPTNFSSSKTNLTDNKKIKELPPLVGMAGQGKYSIPSSPTTGKSRMFQPSPIPIKSQSLN